MASQIILGAYISTGLSVRRLQRFWLEKNETNHDNFRLLRLKNAWFSIVHKQAIAF